MTVRQAVVLCGASVPFGAVRAGEASFIMQPVAGKPLVAHVAEALAGAGVERLVLVPDAAAAALRAYCGVGERWGLAVEYADAGQAVEVGSVLRRVPNGLDARFLLMTCPVLASSQALAELVATEAPAAWLGPQGGERLFVCGEEAVAAIKSASAVTSLTDLLAGHGGVRCAGEAMAVDTAVALWQANIDALEGRLPHLVPSGIERAAGVRAGAGVSVASDARIEPPAYLGTGCSVGRGAVVGPSAVVGEGAIIEDGAEVMHSVISAGSYVGPDTTVNSSFVTGNLLVRCPEGTEVHVPDPFVLGSALPEIPHGGAAGMVGRLVALVGLVLASPALVVLWAAHLLFPARGIVQRREVAGMRGTPDLAGSRAVERVSMHVLGSGRGAFGRLPALWDVLAGRIALVGPEPVGPEQAEEMSEPWMRLRFEVPPGVFQPWHAIPKREWESLEKRVMEVHYAASRGVAQDMRILAAALVNVFRKKAP